MPIADTQTDSDSDSDSTEQTTLTSVVAVRVPDGAAGDLTSGAERRLAGVEGVRAATVGGLRGLEPGLSATVVTVAVELEAAVPADRLRERLTATVAVERVAELTPARE
jgi:hypothetical protein